MLVHENYSLKSLNTFHLDIRARYFSEISEVQTLLEILQTNDLKYQKLLILGGGSNILFTGDYDGLVLHNTMKGYEVLEEDDHHAYVKCGGGEVWHQFVLQCIDRGFAGVENLSLIPGTVGAGPIQNIGAYGVELKDVFHELTTIELRSGEPRTFSHADCHFGYRNSIFKNEFKNRVFITSVTFKLNKKPSFNTSYGAIEHELSRMQVKEKSIKSISDAVCNIRRSKLPDPDLLGNCGSFFKNPEVSKDFYMILKDQHSSLVGYDTPSGKVKLAAGWLIEQCGWKGKRVGNTGSHKDQALVLVNYGEANAMEIVNLSKDIQASVKEKFGVGLEAEVNLI